MGADIKQLRTRIKSVDSTLHLTKAMELVASSKIRKATDSMNKGRQYSNALEECAAQLASFEECKKSPYMAKRDGGRIRLAVIAGDRGLAGGYNANIFRLMREFPDAEVIPIGKRACEKYNLSMRAVSRIQKVARTIADLAGEEKIGKDIELDTILTAQEAKDYGIVDEILERRKA